MVDAKKGMVLNEPPAVVAKSYDSGGAFVLRVGSVMNKGGGIVLNINLPLGDLKTLTAGDWVALYRNGGVVDIHRIEIPIVGDAGIIGLYKVDMHGGSYRISTPRQVVLALGVSGRTKIQFEAYADTNLLLLRKNPGDGRKEPQKAYGATTGRDGTIYLQNDMVDKELDGYSYVAAYRKGANVLFVPVALPPCKGNFISVAHLERNRARDIARISLTKASDALNIKAGDYVKLTETSKALMIQRALNYHPEALVKVISRFNPPSSKYIYLPQQLIENVGLERGGWARLRVNSSGDAEISRLDIKSEPGFRFLRVLKLFSERSYGDMPIFRAPKAAIPVLDFGRGDTVEIRAREDGALLVSKAGSLQVAQRTVPLGTSKTMRQSRGSFGVELPQEEAYNGFGVGDYVLAYVGEESHSMLLMNAGLEAGEVPAKVVLHTHGNSGHSPTYQITLLRELRSLERKRFMALLRAESQAQNWS